MARKGESVSKLLSIELCVEAKPGSTPEEVATELCQLADRIGMDCGTRFNDIRMYASPGDAPDLVTESYYNLLRISRGIKPSG